MPFEGRQRAHLLDRCWSIYLWLTQTFILPESFAVEFPAAAESTLITSTLHVTVPISEKLTLSLREEYVFRLTICMMNGEEFAPLPGRCRILSVSPGRC